MQPARSTSANRVDRRPSASIAMNSPGSISRTNDAPTMSSAAVSLATTQPRSRRPSTSGRTPCGSRAAYSVDSLGVDAPGKYETGLCCHAGDASANAVTESTLRDCVLGYWAAEPPGRGPSAGARDNVGTMSDQYERVVFRVPAVGILAALLLAACATPIAVTLRYGWLVYLVPLAIIIFV